MNRRSFFGGLSVLVLAAKTAFGVKANASETTTEETLASQGSSSVNGDFAKSDDFVIQCLREQAIAERNRIVEFIREERIAGHHSSTCLHETRLRCIDLVIESPERFRLFARDGCVFATYDVLSPCGPVTFWIGCLNDTFINPSRGHGESKT